MTTKNNSWLANQDRLFIEEVCGDYEQDIIDLIEHYRTAPELLEALKRTYKAMEDGSINDYGYDSNYIVQAIKKAEGK